MAKTRNIKKKNRYKSKWEMSVVEQLEKLKLPVKYEQFSISYTVPESEHKYTPDFQVGDGVYVEAKGKFDAADRKKHLLIKEQYPWIKIILLFQNANQRISKRSNTTYGDWCTKNGIRWKHRILELKDVK